jgi:hypothetical protein
VLPVAVQAGLLPIDEEGVELPRLEDRRESWMIGEHQPPILQQHLEVAVQRIAIRTGVFIER